MSEEIRYYIITNGERPKISKKKDSVCQIGIINEDKSVDLIYCHQNSFPSHQTPILLNYYNTAEKVKALIALGDIQYLAKCIEPTCPEKHSSDNPEPDVVLALRRDKGYKWGTPAKTHISLLRENGTLLENPYMYLFDSRTSTWLFGEWDGRSMHFMPFTEPFDEEYLPNGEILLKDLAAL